MQHASDKEDEYCGLVLTYRINDIYFCVPVEQVEAVIEPPRITTYPHAPDYVAGAFQYRNEVALAVRLRTLLKLPEPKPGPKRDCLLMVRVNGKPVGYWIDEIKGMSDSGKGAWTDIPSVMPEQQVNKALQVGNYVYLPVDLHSANNINEIAPILEALKHEHLLSPLPESEQTEPFQPAAVEGKQAMGIEAEPANDAVVAQPEEELEAVDEEKAEASGIEQEDEPAEVAEEYDSPTAELIEETIPEEQDTIPEAEPIPEPAPEHEEADSEMVLEAEPAVVEPNTDEASVVEESPPEVSEEIDDVFDTAVPVEEEISDLDSVADEAWSLQSDIEQAITAEEREMDEGMELEVTPSVFSSEVTFTDEIIRLDQDAVDEAIIDEVPSAAETVSDEADVEQEPLPVEGEGEEGTVVEEALVVEDIDQDMEAVAFLEEALLVEDTAQDMEAVASLEEAVEETEEDAASPAEELLEQSAEVQDEELPVEPVLDETEQTAEASILEEESGELDAASETEQAAEKPFSVEDIEHDMEAMPALDEAVEEQEELAAPIEEDLLEEAVEVQDEGLLIETGLDETTQIAEASVLEEESGELDAEPETELADEEEPEITVTLSEPDTTDELLEEQTTAPPEFELQDELTESASATEQPVQDEYRDVSLDADMTDALHTDLTSAAEQVIETEPALPEVHDEDVQEEIEADALEDMEEEISPSSLEMLEFEESEPVPIVEEKPEPPVDEHIMAELPDEEILDALEFQEEVAEAEVIAEPELHEEQLDDAGLPEFLELEEIDDQVEAAASAESELVEIASFDHVSEQALSSREFVRDLDQELAEDEEEPTPPRRTLGQRIRRFLFRLFIIPMVLAIIAGGVVLWWELLEWSERERLVMQLPPLLRNEVAPMFSSRVELIVPERGPDRLIIDLPQYEVRVISADKVSAILLRQREEISISMHMVKKGDTLLQILEENLQDVERYPDLYKLDSGRGEARVAPGDVVTIVDKRKIP